MTRHSIWLKTSVSSLALAVSLTLFTAPARAADTKDATQVGEVVVTAERRVQNLQTAPLAATALSGAAIEQKGVITVEDLQFATPAMTVNTFGQGNDFNIRGIGKDETNVQTPSGVITYRDGVATFPGFFQDEPFYDENSVEVLRGPQGTFSGQNATGGAIYVTSKDPSLGGFGGDAQLQYGNYNDIQLRGAINMPLSDTFAARIAFNDETHDSFYHITTGPGFSGHPGRLIESNTRLGLLWQPTSKLKVVFKTDVNYIDQGGYPAGPSNQNLFNLSNNAPNVALDRFVRLSLNISYLLDNGYTLKSISGYQHGITQQAVDLDGTNAAPLTFSDLATEEIYSEELNLISPDAGRFRWVGGLYFQHDLVVIPQGGFDIGLPPGGFDIDLIYRTPKQTEAVFAQGTYDLTSALQLQAGARYTYSTFDLTDNNYYDGLPATGTLATGHTNDPKLTGKVDLNWKLDDNNFLYAFVATGHKTGGINTSLIAPNTTLDPIKPEDVTDYEAGWKPTFFDGHLRMQSDIFYSRYTNFQFTYTAAGSAASEVLNSPAPTIIYGLETEGQAVFGHLSFDFGAAYLHSRLGDFTTGDPNSGTPQDLAGNRQPSAPEWTFNVGARYAMPMPDNATLTPAVQYGYVGDQWSTVFQKDPADAANHLAQRNLVNADLTYRRDSWEAALYATNLTNLHYVAATNVGLSYAGAPQQFGVRLKKSF